MKRLQIAVFVSALLFILSGPVFAHHGTAAFDTSQTVTVKATMVQFDFTNPHCELFST